jgi:hypothetical protein
MLSPDAIHSERVVNERVSAVCQSFRTFVHRSAFSSTNLRGRFSEAFELLGFLVSWWFQQWEPAAATVPGAA